MLSFLCGLILLSACNFEDRKPASFPARTLVQLTLTAGQQEAADINSQYPARLAYFEQFRQENVDLCCLGDSITERLDWQDAYPSLRVSNRGIGSDTTLGILARLDDIEAQSPRVISLLIGINDISIGRKPDEIIETYGELLDELSRRLPNTSIIVTSVLPVTATHVIDNRDVILFNDLLRPLCEEKGVVYLDVYDGFCDASGNLDVAFATDDVHPNIAGYLIWLRSLDEALRASF